MNENPGQEISEFKEKANELESYLNDSEVISELHAGLGKLKDYMETFNPETIIIPGTSTIFIDLISEFLGIPNETTKIYHWGADVNKTVYKDPSIHLEDRIAALNTLVLNINHSSGRKALENQRILILDDFINRGTKAIAYKNTLAKIGLQDLQYAAFASMDRKTKNAVDHISVIPWFGGELRAVDKLIKVIHELSIARAEIVNFDNSGENNSLNTSQSNLIELKRVFVERISLLIDSIIYPEAN